MLTRKMCMSIVNTCSPCCGLISNQMCSQNLWHVHVRDIMIGLIELHGKIWLSFFSHSIWISGVVFQVRFSLWLKFSLEIMDLHIRCSLKKKYICTKNSYIHSFCIFISCFDVMFKILFLMFCIALKKLKVNSIQNRTVC